MVGLILSLAALFLGVALLVTGSGLLGTLLALRGAHEGMSDTTLGLVMSGYFLGFFFGTYAAPPLIRRLGHIRAFAFCAAAAASAVALHAVLVDAWVWAVLRIITGAALVSLYTVIESWLNAEAPNARRGQVFSVYMVVVLLALALGQQMLRLAPVQGFELFVLVTLLTCIALMPVAWTRLPQPDLGETPSYGVGRLWQDAPAAAVGALLSGMAMGAFWGLGPLYATHVGLDRDGVAGFMSAAILGGAALQWPLGHWSDRVDRRRVLAAVSLGAAVAGIWMLLAPADGWSGTLGIFVYGGFAFTVYSLAVAHLMDRLQPQQMLGGSSAVLMLYGIGAALGPALAGRGMQQFGPTALFGFAALMHLLLAGFVIWRMLHRRRGSERPAHFMPMLRTTPTAMEMLPDTPDPSTR